MVGRETAERWSTPPVSVARGGEGPAHPAARIVQLGFHCFARHQFLTSWVLSDVACCWEGQEGQEGAHQQQLSGLGVVRSSPSDHM